MDRNQYDLKSCVNNDNDIKDPFVAAAIKIDDQGIAEHSGIFIRVDDSSYLLHYTSVDVRLESPGQWYYFKTFHFIQPDFVRSFLAYCKNIKRNANPQYGYVYGGSLYDQNGRHFPVAGLPEIFTCVGFCLNVINGFIEDDEFVSFQDWNNSSIPSSDSYLQYFIRDYSSTTSDSQMQQLIANMRRIKPSEYLSLAFITTPPFPVRKTQIDDILHFVEQSIKSKRLLVA